MELRKSFSFRGTVIFLYMMAMAIYVAFGFAPASVEAVNYEISAKIAIPSINLTSDVTTLRVQNNSLETPDTIVGSFSRENSKIFLVGHRSTVFRNLDQVKIGDIITYNDTTYTIREMVVKEKAEISMNELLEASPVETLVVMTCAGENLGGGDATHRLIITATR